MFSSWKHLDTYGIMINLFSALFCWYLFKYNTKNSSAKFGEQWASLISFQQHHLICTWAFSVNTSYKGEQYLNTWMKISMLRARLEYCWRIFSFLIIHTWFKRSIECTIRMSSVSLFEYFILIFLLKKENGCRSWFFLIS